MPPTPPTLPPEGTAPTIETPGVHAGDKKSGSGGPTPVESGWRIGVALVVVAAVYAASKPIEGGDTWLSIAGGRQIIDRGAVPRSDTLSFTFAGRPWMNQNWLTHVVFALIHDRIAPDALVALKVGVVCITGFLLFAAATRACGSAGWAALATAVALLVSRDYLDIRAQLATFAGTGVLLWVYARGRTGGTFVWLLPAAYMVIWSNAHGGFVFGLVLHAVLTAAEVFRGNGARRLAPMLSLIGSIVIAAACSPYGVENLRHPQVVHTSEVFQSVNEWRPIWDSVAGPPVAKFAWLLAWIGAIVILSVAFIPGRRVLPERSGAVERLPGPDPVLMLVAGATLLMAVNSRRFIPLFCLAAVPAAAQWQRLVLIRAWETWRRGRAAGDDLMRLERRTTLAAWPALLAFVLLAGRAWPVEYFGEPAQSCDSLFSRMTQEWSAPRRAAEWLAVRGPAAAEARILNDWTFGGYLLYRVPGLRVYIDGRSQAAYDEAHVVHWIMLDTGGYRGARMSEKQARAAFDEPFGRIDAAVVRPRSFVAGVLRGWNRWRVVSEDAVAVVFVRSGSALESGAGR